MHLVLKLHGRRMFKVVNKTIVRSVQLTASRYPEVKRGNYSDLTDSHVQFFERCLGSRGVITDPEDLEAVNIDWLGIYRGNSKCMLKPNSTDQVSAILKYCFDKNLAVCTQGGNTGLVGGSISVYDEIILNTQSLNKLIDFDKISGILSCEAGCILENLDNEVAGFGYMMPLDLGSKGSCCIGGNVSTAAGGMRLLRYGSLHAHLLGIEAVLADSEGTVLDCMKSLRKDNTGLHLPHLFLGAEGTLGVVTKVAMTCVPRPSSINVSLLGCDTFEACCQLLSKAKSQLGEILSSFEWMDSEAMRCLEENLKLTHPLSQPANFYVLVETAGSNADHDYEKLNKFLENCLEEKTVIDGTVAADVEQARYIWSLRERCAEALVRDGHTYKQDFSLDLKHFYELVDVTREKLGSLARRVVAYGHLGDGNLHLNITSPQFSQEISQLLYPFLYQWVSERNGSISAEHGLGFAKRNYGHLCNSKAAMKQMLALKRTFDPKLILNPYKTFRVE